MTLYRFVTPHRTGKWYPDLVTAQRQAFAIGAGFFDERTGRFYPYRETRLEQTDQDRLSRSENRIGTDNAAAA